MTETYEKQEKILWYIQILLFAVSLYIYFQMGNNEMIQVHDFSDGRPVLFQRKDRTGCIFFLCRSLWRDYFVRINSDDGFCRCLSFSGTGYFRKAVMGADAGAGTSLEDKIHCVP